MASKKKNNYRHAVMRMKERYGIELSKQEYLGLCRQIQHGGSPLVEKQWNNKTVHLVNVRGHKVAVIYSKNQNNIVTILPPWVV
jgi:hypothetical protein